MSRPLPTSLDQALAAAVRAPSPHNSQPWRFEVDGERIDLWLDRDRVLTVADPEAREARLSCGAALMNLILSLRSNGEATTARLVPDAAAPDLLATVRVQGNQKSSLPERKLAEAVFRRHTNRRPLLDRPVPPRARSALVAAATTEGGRLECLDTLGRYDAVASLVRRAEFLQATDREFRAETARWTGRAVDSPDGVPTTAAGPPPEYAGAVSLRESHTNTTLPPKPYEQQPLLAAVLTREQGHRADVRAGMVMQRVLLTATSIGLESSFLSQPFETPETRPDLDDLFSDIGQIHTLLRIGYGYPAPMTSRRPVSEVMTRCTGPDRALSERSRHSGG
jgi:nitroreductase